MHLLSSQYCGLSVVVWYPCHSKTTQDLKRFLSPQPTHYLPHLLLPRLQASPGYVRHSLRRSGKQNTKASPWCVLGSAFPVWYCSPYYLGHGNLVHLYFSEANREAIPNIRNQQFLGWCNWQKIPEYYGI